MYGGCAPSTERSEAPPKAADSRVGCAGGLALRAPLAADGVGAVAPVASGSASSLVGVTAVVDVAARWCRGVLRCRWPPNCALALRGSGGAGFHVRLTPQCRGAVGCGSVCGVAAAGTANAVGGALPCGRRRGCGRLALFRAVRRRRGCGRSGGLALFGGTEVAGARVVRRRRMARSARRA